MPLKSSLGVFVAFLLISSAPFARGNMIRFDFGQNAGSTGENVPDVTAVFSDVGPNQVNLTITASDFSGGNSINALFFNFNPAFNVAGLTFTQIAPIGGVQGDVRLANNSFKASGGGKFDIKIDFSSSPFITGNTLVYSITGIGPFSVNDFAFPNTPSAGHPLSYAAGSIQDLSQVVIVNGSPSPVPDADSTAGLLGLAMLALFSFRNTRRLPA